MILLAKLILAYFCEPKSCRGDEPKGPAPELWKGRFLPVLDLDDARRQKRRPYDCVSRAWNV